MFLNTINHLYNQASNPTTEFHQKLYNDFIDSYGTHYVSYVTMGMKLRIYVFIHENYSKVHSHEELVHESLLMTEYERLLFETHTDNQSLYNSISQSFKLNTYILLDVQPRMSDVTNMPNSM